ncbi:hypothetical protein SDC9_110712 [bioreactor metagenome]|uniref:Uncharacterized protein n=1 Tax=bioreactor metagenome TaxID=1076179 RepID=A0A645BFJ2_9ZZZZ
MALDFKNEVIPKIASGNNISTVITDISLNFSPPLLTLTLFIFTPPYFLISIYIDILL